MYTIVDFIIKIAKWGIEIVGDWLCQMVKHERNTKDSISITSTNGNVLVIIVLIVTRDALILKAKKQINFMDRIMKIYELKIMD
jgi:hypothetical protein